MILQKSKYDDIDANNKPVKSGGTNSYLAVTVV